VHNKNIIMNIGERKTPGYLTHTSMYETAKGHREPASRPITLSFSIVRFVLRTEYRSTPHYFLPSRSSLPPRF